jgi:membrane-associated phospholipid phosphatase
MNYVNLYEKNKNFINRRPILKKLILPFNRYLPYLFLIFYAGFFVYAAFFMKAFQHDVAYFVFLPLCTLITVSVLRIFIARPRPYSDKGAGITPMVHKKGADHTSCPSRHIACATAISIAFLPFSLPIALFLQFITVLLAYLRFSVGVHYILDLVIGYVLPWIIYLFYTIAMAAHLVLAW